MVVFETEHGECEVRITNVDAVKGVYFDEYVKLNETSLNDHEKVHGMKCDRYFNADDHATYWIEATIRKDFKLDKFDALLADIIIPEIGTVATVTVIEACHYQDGVKEDVTRLVDEGVPNPKFSSQKTGLFLQPTFNGIARLKGNPGTLLNDFTMRIRKIKWDNPAAIHQPTTNIPIESAESDLSDLALFVSQKIGEANSDEKVLPSATGSVPDLLTGSDIKSVLQVASECDVFQVRFYCHNLDHLKVAGMAKSPPPYYMFPYEGLHDRERCAAWRELQELLKVYVRQELVKRNKPREIQKYFGAKPISKEQPYYLSTWKSLTRVRKDFVFLKLLSAIQSYEKGDRLLPFHNQVFEVISLYDDDQQHKLSKSAEQDASTSQHQGVEENNLKAEGDVLRHENSDVPLASTSRLPMPINQEFRREVITQAPPNTKRNRPHQPEISTINKGKIIDLTKDSDDEDIESLEQQIETQKVLAGLQARRDEARNRKRIKREVKSEPE